MIVFSFLLVLSSSRFSVSDLSIDINYGLRSKYSHPSLSSYPPIGFHRLPIPINITSFVSQAGPDHYIVCAEPSVKIQLGMLVQDNSWGGPLIVEKVWAWGKGLTILRCKGRCLMGENIVRFLVVDDKFLAIPWERRPFWRKLMTSRVMDRDRYLPVFHNQGFLPFPSHRFALSDYQLNLHRSYFCFCIPYSTSWFS